MRLGGNDYTLRELGGAFGDLGTLVPFLAGYIAITGMDPAGVLLGFGVFGVATGLHFKTPVAVQPMKAIGTAAISHPGAVTPGAVLVSGFVTGIVWLLMGLSGLATWIAALTGRPVVQGLVLGLGLGFVREGVTLMEGDFALALTACVLAFALVSRPRVPAMLVLLLVGAVTAIAREPGLLDSLTGLAPRPRLPVLPLDRIGWEEVVTGVFGLALPQVALTLGNAVVATVETNNRLFPARPVSVRSVALDHGVMNLVASGFGGVPMCHGAGGMAGHMRFGARTGGATVMLGAILIVTGVFLADSVGAFLGLVPRAVVGVILLLGGLEFALGAAGGERGRGDASVMLLTAGVGMWNMGAGYLAGLALWHSYRRGWLHP
ncbi:MAG TPA: putative sulfate/molybdate transporter [Candidatus Limnocylindrales bacterium]|nr:putative sulfate/molybdate transporter [Candidatus Limnocylindrales bacterium]